MVGFYLVFNIFLAETIFIRVNGDKHQISRENTYSGELELYVTMFIVQPYPFP